MHPSQQDALLRLAENEDLATLVGKLRFSPGMDFDLTKIDKLENTERQRISTYHQALALRFDNTAFQHQSGYISDADMEFLMKGLPRFLKLWKKLEVRVNPALQRYIDAKELAT